MRTLNQEQQQHITPKKALDLLIKGNERFVENNTLHRDLVLQASMTRHDQFPFAALLGCMDSRAPAEHIFDQGIGDIFNIRVAGNIVNEDVLGSLEYACKVVGAKIIVVMGHTGCGAIKSAVEQVQMGNITALLSKIKPAIDLYKSSQQSNTIEMDRITILNVQNSMNRILKESPILSEMLDNDEIMMVGALYSVASGVVSFIK